MSEAQMQTLALRMCSEHTENSLFPLVAFITNYKIKNVQNNPQIYT
jgi:hypothetical protein